MEGYKYLKSYVLATVLYDLTMQFCSRFFGERQHVRQREQTEQAARSGKQNIAEGYTFESLKSYIKLLGVAHGSIKELQEDMQDFLRQRGLKQCDKDDSRIRAFREFRAAWVTSTTLNTPKLPNDPEEAANMLVTLCNQCEFLLTRQIEALKAKFIKEGGWTEQLRKKRLEERKRGPSWHPFSWGPPKSD